MPEFYNRQGILLPNTVAWARLYEDTAYRNVAVDIEEAWMVSTIWEGFEATQPEHPRLFETAILHHGELVQKFRWYTEKEALEGHAEVVRHAFEREPRPEDGYLERILEAERERDSSN